jgi:cell division protein FtsW (lipid II flippase)
MKNRASSHFILLLLIVIFAAIAHYAIYYAALIRGYETSWVSAGRDIGLLLLLAVLPLFMSRLLRFQGNWTLYTTAVLMFSIGLTIQYRLFADDEYISKEHKMEARQAKIATQQLHYIQENYSAEKKQMMGLPATPPSPVDLAKEKPRPAKITLKDVLLSEFTFIPLISILFCIIAIYLMQREDVFNLIQRHGFFIVMLTLGPLVLAAITSHQGKSIGNMTPWEPAKIPFLVGFAAVLGGLYRNLGQTYWGIPRAKDVLPMVFMAAMPFIPFFLLKDFGQMMVFSGVYITLYLVAVRRLPQRILFTGTVALAVVIITLAAMPASVQVKVPLLSQVAEPIRNHLLPRRIPQRFHLWFDALNPPPPDAAWWKTDLEDYYYQKYPEDLVERKPEAKPLFDEMAKIQTDKDKLPKGDAQRTILDKRRAEIVIELKKLAGKDISEMYALTRGDSAPPSSDETQTSDEDEIGANQEDEKTIKETKEKLVRMNEEAWFGDDALQASRATFGVSSGGKTGRGLGLGFVELIPVADSDYVYAAISEELGLFGGLLVTFALIILVSAGVRTALDARNMFSKLCATGLTAFIGFQALVNMGGITRALPMTGITLPFVSHGGFSLLTSFVMLGMLMAISHRNAVDHSIDQANALPPARTGTRL